MVESRYMVQEYIRPLTDVDLENARVEKRETNRPDGKVKLILVESEYMLEVYIQTLRDVGLEEEII